MANAFRKEIWAWASYDWANSAYSTLSITLLLSYIQEVVFPKDTYGTTGEVVWAWGISIGGLVSGCMSPVFGAISDARRNKHRWLAATALGGASLCVVLAMVPPKHTWLITILFVCITFCFELSLGFYNAFLPQLVSEENMNRVSALGFGLGYVGGGLALLLSSIFLSYGEQGEWASMPVLLRICLAVFMGLWWGLFSIPAVLILRDHGTQTRHDLSMFAATKAALAEIQTTIKHIKSFRILSFFLLGFLFYNDGVQTVLSQSGSFAKNVLDFKTKDLILLVLMVQFLALPGAFLVGWISDRISQRTALNGCLLIWVGLLVAAYFTNTQQQFWILAAVLSMVMGGTQSVSRAIMGRMTPARHAGEFFGFFNFSGKAVSFLGPFVFGLVVKFTGDSRLAILSLLPEFIIGWWIVARLDFNRGRQDALAAEDHSSTVSQQGDS